MFIFLLNASFRVVVVVGVVVFVVVVVVSCCRCCLFSAFDCSTTSVDIHTCICTHLWQYVYT